MKSHAALNIDNPDLIYISCVLANVRLYAATYDAKLKQLKCLYRKKYTLGFSRLSPLALLDILVLLFTLKTSKVEVCRLHTTDFHSLAVLFVARLKGLRVIYNNHDAVAHQGYGLIRRTIIRLVNYLLFRFADEVRFFSQYNRARALTVFPFLSRRQTLLVDELPSVATIFSPTKASVLAHVKYHDFVIFGRDEAYKNDYVMIRTLLAWCDQAGLSIGVAGRISDNPVFEARKCVKRYGFVSNIELIALVDRARYGVLPYRSCSQSGVMAFMLARKLPMLASEIPAFREYAAHQLMRLVIPDSAGFTQLLQRL